MEETEEADPIAEAERGRAFGLVDERRVVQLQLVERIAQRRIIAGIDRVDPREDHRLGRFVARQRILGGLALQGHRIPHAHVPHILQPGGDITDLARGQLIQRCHPRCKGADLQRVGTDPALDHANLVPFAQRAIHHADVGHHPFVGIVVAVENEGAQWRIALAPGRRDIFDHRFQHRVRVFARLGRNRNHLFGGQADQRLDLFRDQIGLRPGQVDLVDHRHDLQVLIDRQVKIGQRLGLHPLRGIDHQDRPFAGLQGTADLVGEVDVAGRVDQVKLIRLAVAGGVVQPHSAGLDRDALLPFEVHIVEHLLLHLSFGDGAGLNE